MSAAFPMTLADGAERWARSRGLAVPPRSHPAWKAMYAAWQRAGMAANPGPASYRRRNADEDLRELARLAAQGDPGAQQRLLAAQARAGVGPKNVVTSRSGVPLAVVFRPGSGGLRGATADFRGPDGVTLGSPEISELVHLVQVAAEGLLIARWREPGVVDLVPLPEIARLLAAIRQTVPPLPSYAQVHGAVGARGALPVQEGDFWLARQPSGSDTYIYRQVAGKLVRVGYSGTMRGQRFLDLRDRPGMTGPSLVPGAPPYQDAPEFTHARLWREGREAEAALILAKYLGPYLAPGGRVHLATSLGAHRSIVPASVAPVAPVKLTTLRAPRTPAAPVPFGAPVTDHSRDAVSARIRAALRKRSGKDWSVRAGSGTASGWLTIASPPRRLDAQGGMTPAEQAELAALLNIPVGTGVSHQGVSVPSGHDFYEEYVARAEGRTPTRYGVAHWRDNPTGHPLSGYRVTADGDEYVPYRPIVGRKHGTTRPRVRVDLDSEAVRVQQEAEELRAALPVSSNPGPRGGTFRVVPLRNGRWQIEESRLDDPRWPHGWAAYGGSFATKTEAENALRFERRSNPRARRENRSGLGDFGSGEISVAEARLGSGLSASSRPVLAIVASQFAGGRSFTRSELEREATGTLRGTRGLPVSAGARIGFTLPELERKGYVARIGRDLGPTGRQGPIRYAVTKSGEDRALADSAVSAEAFGEDALSREIARLESQTAPARGAGPLSGPYYRPSLPVLETPGHKLPALAKTRMRKAGYRVNPGLAGTPGDPASVAATLTRELGPAGAMSYVYRRILDAHAAHDRATADYWLTVDDFVPGPKADEFGHYAENPGRRSPASATRRHAEGATRRPARTHNPRSKACQVGSHAFDPRVGACTRAGCTARLDEPGQGMMFGYSPEAEAEARRRVAASGQGEMFFGDVRRNPLPLLVLGAGNPGNPYEHPEHGSPHGGGRSPRQGRSRAGNPSPTPPRVGPRSRRRPPAHVPGVREADQGYARFHGHEGPGHWRCIDIEDGRRSLTERAVFALGTQPASAYRVPFDKRSNKAGDGGREVWEHAWEREPLLVMDPLSGMQMTVPARGNRVTDWMRG